MHGSIYGKRYHAKSCVSFILYLFQSEMKSIFNFFDQPVASKLVSRLAPKRASNQVSRCNLDEQFPARSGAGIRKPPTYVSRSKFRTVGHLG